MFRPIDSRIDGHANRFPRLAVFGTKELRKVIVTEAQKKNQTLVGPRLREFACPFTIAMNNKGMKSKRISAKCLINRMTLFARFWGWTEQPLVEASPIKRIQVLAVLGKIVVIQSFKLGRTR